MLCDVGDVHPVGAFPVGGDDRLRWHVHVRWHVVVEVEVVGVLT